jgi:hypothetical protein
MARLFGFLVVLAWLSIADTAYAARLCTSNADCNGGGCGFAVSSGTLVARYCTVIQCSRDGDCDRGDKCLAGICTGNFCSTSSNAPSNLSCPNGSSCVNFLTKTECVEAPGAGQRTCLTSECRS